MSPWPQSSAAVGLSVAQKLAARYAAGPVRRYCCINSCFDRAEYPCCVGCRWESQSYASQCREISSRCPSKTTPLMQHTPLKPPAMLQRYVLQLLCFSSVRVPSLPDRRASKKAMLIADTVCQRRSPLACLKAYAQACQLLLLLPIHRWASDIHCHARRRALPRCAAKPSILGFAGICAICNNMHCCCLTNFGA